MLHEPAARQSRDPAAAYKTSLGLKMFIFYSLFYGGFVAINLLAPVLMEARIAFGLNLASVYGFGLIVLALVMALIYNYMCGRREAALLGDHDVTGELGGLVP
jgi:uncharacterized membrane protein (DUF485 family)